MEYALRKLTREEGDKLSGRKVWESFTLPSGSTKTKEKVSHVSTRCAEEGQRTVTSTTFPSAHLRETSVWNVA